jgi:hypothetical protein
MQEKPLLEKDIKPKDNATRDASKTLLDGGSLGGSTNAVMHQRDGSNLDIEELSIDFQRIVQNALLAYQNQAENNYEDLHASEFCAANIMKVY